MILYAIKWFGVLACGAAWLYAALHGAKFEKWLGANVHDPRQLESLNHPSSLFRRKVHRRASQERRKALAGLALFFGLGLCVLVVIYLDAGASPAKSSFTFH